MYQKCVIVVRSVLINYDEAMADLERQETRCSEQAERDVLQIEEVVADWGRDNRYVRPHWNTFLAALPEMLEPLDCIYSDTLSPLTTGRGDVTLPSPISEAAPNHRP